MGFDRRGVLFAAAAAMMSGCARAQPARPAMMTGSWAAFKRAFLQADGRVVDTGNGGVSHTEGQGYGMILAEVANDQEAFDSMLGWTEQVLARKDVALFSWRYNPKDAVPVGDVNDAADGDTLIAWALMRASRRWHRPEYGARASQIRDAIRTRLIRKQSGHTVLLPGLAGFDQGGKVTLNLSYYIWPALDLFRATDGASAWGEVIEGGESLLRQARFGSLALPTDWIDLTGSDQAMPAAGRPARFGFDAVRVPLYLMLSGRQAAAADVARFWRSCVASNGVIPAWIDVTTGERAPYPLSEGGMAIAARLIGKVKPVAAPPKPDYYSEVLKNFAKL